MPKRIDEPCPICGRPCSTWAISVDTNEDMVLCWEGDYKVRGLENHKRLSGIVTLVRDMMFERRVMDMEVAQGRAASPAFYNAQRECAEAWEKLYDLMGRYEPKAVGGGNANAEGD